MRNDFSATPSKKGVRNPGRRERGGARSRRLPVSGVVLALVLGLGSTLALLGPTACSDDDGGGPQPDGGVDATSSDALPDDVILFPDSAVPDAFVATCGNGEVEEGEVCDDGNTTSGDGCNSSCTIQDAWDYVGSHFTTGDQDSPAVACNGDVVAAAWTDWSGYDGDGAGVRLRLYGTDGVPITTVLGHDEELRVNAVTTHHQRDPDVGITPNGSIVMVWTDDSGDAGAPGDIRMQIYTPDGARVGSEKLVNTTVAGDQQTPTVAVTETGTVMVVWADGSGAAPDTDGYAIRGRLFTEDGTPTTNGVTGDASDFVVNGTTASIQRDPTACPSGGGGFFVAWSDASGVLDGDGYGVAATVTDATGTPLMADIAINSHTAGHQFGPDAILQPGFGPVVFWTDGSLSDDLQETGIRGRLVAPDGSFRLSQYGDDADFPVNTTTAQSQELPAVASQPNGDMLVVWQDWSGADGSASAIVGRPLSELGGGAIFPLSDTGDDFTINTTFLGAQRSPSLCHTGDWFVVFWTDESGSPPDEDGHAVRFRLLPQI